MKKKKKKKQHKKYNHNKMKYWKNGIRQHVSKYENLQHIIKKTVVTAYGEICTDCAIFDNSEATSTEHDETAH